MKLADLPEVEKLSLHEKLELIDELWVSMGKDLESESISEAEKRMLDERWARYESNPESALTLKEVKVKLAARLGR